MEYIKCGIIHKSVSNSSYILSCFSCGLKVDTLIALFDHFNDLHSTKNESSTYESSNSEFNDSQGCLEVEFNENKIEIEGITEFYNKNDYYNISNHKEELDNLDQNKEFLESQEENEIAESVVKNIRKRKKRLNKIDYHSNNKEKLSTLEQKKQFSENDTEITDSVVENIRKSKKRLVCELCGKTVSTKTRFDEHTRIHTGEKPFACKFCPKTCYSKSALYSHENTHYGLKPFKCEYCEMTFKTKCNKQTHEKKHHLVNQNSDEQPKDDFFCNLCTKTFKNLTSLNLHLKRHENESNVSEKPFQCNFCYLSFKKKEGLRGHERLKHNGEYNYECKFCGKRFLKLGSMKDHEEIHTRVKNNFKCDLCELSYARKEGLKKHKVQKHKNYAYKCKICESDFHSLILYQEHCRTHNAKEIQLECNICKEKFNCDKSLLSHVSKFHEPSCP